MQRLGRRPRVQCRQLAGTPGGVTGLDNVEHTLVEHYDGHKWTQKDSPHPGRSSKLLGVTATSSGNAWAVGQSFNGTSTQTLIERWNGKNGHKWSRVPAPSLSNADQLNAVDASSGSSLWAVGTVNPGTFTQALAVHCC